MNRDQKIAMVNLTYNAMIGNLMHTLVVVKRRESSPETEYAIKVLDDLIGHLQTRREKQIARVK